MSMRKVAATIALTACAVSLAACSTTIKRNVTFGAVTPWPTARPALPREPPIILAAQLSGSTVHIGRWWSGRVATTTNIASVVLSTPFAALVIPRTSFGEFAFDTRVLDVPSVYRQSVMVSITAYTASGRSAGRETMVEFR